MIQAKDLRIGNWVKHYAGELMQVWGIDYQREEYDGWFIRFDNGDCAIEREGDVEFFIIEGVPLTEEWLLNLGFLKKKEDDVFGYVKDFTSKGLGDDRAIQFSLVPSEFHDLPKGQWVAGMESMIFKEGLAFTAIEHVHQLQNLYFALTGTELDPSHSHRTALS